MTRSFGASALPGSPATLRKRGGSSPPAASPADDDNVDILEVRGDGLLLVRDRAVVNSLSPPWVLASAHDEILVELKLQSDHPRSSLALDEFVRWVSARRSAAWVLRMLQILPMSPSVREELLRYIPQTDDPEIRARQRHIAEVLIDMNPELQDKLVRKGIERAVTHLAERRLGRALQEAEQAMLAKHFDRLGAERVEDVVFSFSADALSAWLSDPSAR